MRSSPAGRRSTMSPAARRGTVSPAMDPVGKALAKFHRYAADRGGNSRRNWQKIFDTSIDDSQDGHVTIDELQDALLDMGVEIRNSDLMAVRKHLDADNSGTITFEEFFEKVAPKMNPLRKELCNKVWLRLKQEATKGRVSRKQIEKACVIKHHVNVTKYDQPPSAAMAEMLDAICRKGSEATKDGWLKYWKEISLELEDDDQFGSFFSQMWNLPFIPSFSMAKALKWMSRQILSTESMTLDEAKRVVHTTLKRHDRDNSGELDPEEFGAVLRDLGINLPERELQALFEYFDADASGTVSTDELTSKLMGAASKYSAKKTPTNRRHMKG